jgi:hypothetical protein
METLRRGAPITVTDAGRSDLDRLGGEQLGRLEIGEVVRVAVRHSDDRQVDAARVRVVARPAGTDGDLALVGRAASFRPGPQRKQQRQGLQAINPGLEGQRQQQNRGALRSMNVE